MTLASRLVARWAKLPPARTRAVAVERDLRTPMPDSAVLLADRWYPADGDRPPVVILRSPYGRRQLGLVGRLLAERGYSAFLQSTRGSFGSAGGWDPFRNEQADGHATLAWVAEQPWSGGSAPRSDPVISASPNGPWPAIHPSISGPWPCPSPPARFVMPPPIRGDRSAWRRALPGST